MRILSLSHGHEVLAVGDRIIEVNGNLVTGLSVKEVADCVRRRRSEKILSLVVEKPRKWWLERMYDRREQHR